MNNNNIENLINDIKNLQGANVSIFGQPIALKDSSQCNFNPQVLNLLEELRGYESELTGIEYNEELEEYEEKQFYTIEEYMDYLEEVDGLQEVKSDNSYNWSSNIDHDIDFTIYRNRSDDTFLVELSVHRYGDVRGNYTNDVLLKFDSDYDFIEILHDSTIVVNYITVDNEEYCISIDICDEGYNVYNRENDTDFMIYDYLETEANFIQAIKEHTEGNQN